MYKTLMCGLGGAGSYLARNSRAGHPAGDIVLVNIIENAPKDCHARFLPIASRIVSVAHGRQATMAAADKLEGMMQGYDQLIVMAGLGGNTGTGALPVVIQLALARGMHVVAALTLPFEFENRRRPVAMQALQALNGLDARYVLHDHAHISRQHRHRRMDDYLAFVARRMDAGIQHYTGKTGNTHAER